ncbi:MAG TPA: MBL fold metallo-hydrolase [Panacibacter sp.]|nr:MBL fold metallo-hydrolase [Panacibacter sp.]HNP44368.1 MBL fold metallo-hydrolase [Panacibacter sp.]
MQQITGNLFQLALGAVNVFVIEDDGLTLVDTGYENSTDKIFSALQKAGKDPAAIKRVILTHCHPDHSGSVAEINRRLGVPVYAHVNDVTLLESGIGGREPKVLSPGLMNWIIFQLFIKRGSAAIQAVKIDEQLHDNDIIPVAGGIQVIHTPGHCAGHIALLLKSEGLLISGDLCANVMGLDLSTVYEDRATGIDSILKAAAFDFDRAVFGHGKLLGRAANKKMHAHFLPFSKRHQ